MSGSGAMYANMYRYIHIRRNSILRCMKHGVWVLCFQLSNVWRHYVLRILKNESCSWIVSLNYKKLFNCMEIHGNITFSQLLTSCISIFHIFSIRFVINKIVLYIIDTQLSKHFCKLFKSHLKIYIWSPCLLKLQLH